MPGESACTPLGGQKTLCVTVPSHVIILHVTTHIQHTHPDWTVQSPAMSTAVAPEQT